MTWDGRTLYIQERVYNLALSAWLTLEGDQIASKYLTKILEAIRVAEIYDTVSMEDMEYQNFHCMWSTLVEDIK